MGHEGSTFEKFYIPDLLLKDFQSIYFGTPSNQKLIESAGQMGMSRDNRAPIKLTEKEREEISVLNGLDWTGLMDCQDDPSTYVLYPF